ncbi:MAG: hypothetical protein IR153_06230 [Flavobacterium sp.]|nr:hypothetical protein [Flavobacterium sp.]
MKKSLYKTFLYYIAVLFLLTILAFWAKFHNYSFINSTPENWLTVVDYAGGILNPIISLLNLIFFVRLTLSIKKSTENNSWAQKAEFLNFSLIELYTDMLTFTIQCGYDLDDIKNPSERTAYLLSNEEIINNKIKDFKKQIFAKQNILRVYINSTLFRKCNSRLLLLECSREVTLKINQYLEMLNGKHEPNKLELLKQKHTQCEIALQNLIQAGKLFSDEIYEV